MFRFSYVIDFAAVAFIISAASFAKASDSLVQTEIEHSKMFTVTNDRLQSFIKPETATNNDDGVIMEWSRPDRSVAAQFGRAKGIPAIWRLTEVESSVDSKTQVRTFKATTTTFDDQSVRAKTFCEGPVTESAQCVTASLKFCREFKAKSSRDFGMNTASDGTREKLLGLGKQCADYANYLGTTLNPNQRLNSTDRAIRDDDTVTKDIAAIRSVKDAMKTGDLKGLSGIDDWHGKEDKVGASTTGMKNRSERLQGAANDFLILSKLAVMCSELQFAGKDAGTKWKNPTSSGATKR